MDYDLIIVGTGAGGGTLAYALKDSGLKILILERGSFMPQEKENWDAKEVFVKNRYKPIEPWYDKYGNSFIPGVNYAVGGATKIFGAVMLRLRKEDFEEVKHLNGKVSPAWPINYDELEPYYSKAEKIYGVHGSEIGDPTEPYRKMNYPFSKVEHEPILEEIAVRLKKQKLNPSYLPLAIDYHEGGKCIRCKTCDGFPCKINAKGDADISCIRPSIASPNVRLITNAYVNKLLTNEVGDEVRAVQYEKDGKIEQVSAKKVIVSCGAVNSSVLLLKSANEQHPNGLANESNLVGRNYMMHNNTGLISTNLRKNTTKFQKTLSINDFYFGKKNFPYPMGNIQMLGKLQGSMMKSFQPKVPNFLLDFIANRTVDWFIMSEDLPDLNNRVLINDSDNIQINWEPNNLEAHNMLIKETKRLLRKAGYPIVISQSMVSVGTNSHQCGTIKFGNDPKTSVLNEYCKTHSIKNLYVVDASFFPSSAATNPALTIAAQALRVAEHIGKEMLGTKYNFF